MALRFWLARTGFRACHHAVGRARERREYPRARLALPLHVERVAGQRGSRGTPLRTQNISSSGLYYLSPQRIEPGTPIEIEILLVDRPLGRGSVRMRTEAPHRPRR